MWKRHRRSVFSDVDLNKNEIKQCETCLKDFFKPQFYSWKEWKSKKYCSRKCYWKTVSPKMKGKSHPCKKKGTGNGWLHKNSGYRVMIHPISGKKILEHRYFMECKLGRILQRNEQVHHINHVRSDNRIDNLILMSSKAHHKLHSQEIYMGFNKGKTIIHCKKCGGRFFTNPCH